MKKSCPRSCDGKSLSYEASGVPDRAAIARFRPTNGGAGTFRSPEATKRVASKDRGGEHKASPLFRGEKRWGPSPALCRLFARAYVDWQRFGITRLVILRRDGLYRNLRAVLRVVIFG